MFDRIRRRPGRAELQARLDALDATTAVVEFRPDGRVLWANALFLDLMGYELEEVVGHHHRMFVERSETATEAYGRMWADLARGRDLAGEFRRVRKDGSAVWIEGRYSALRGRGGRVTKVVEYASDITERRRIQHQAAVALAQLEAIRTTTAVIEFEPDGRVIDANQVFLDLMGYRPEELRGRHHRTFVPPEEAASEDYARFWRELARGRSRRGEFERRAKDGRSVWIEGQYNPLTDADGRVFRVVKYAHDITERKRRELGSRINDELLACARELRATADGLIANARETASSSERTLIRANEMTDFSQDVAGAADEMLASLRTISDSAQDLSAQLRDAVRAAQDSLALMDALRASNDEISRVSEAISRVADQTNLLALNAAIEAASAGEAGRGFAVVAAEVKDLARETMLATDQIDARVRDVTGRSSDVGQALERIHEVVDRIGGLAELLSESVVEQTAATGQISGSVAEAAEGARAITEEMGGLARAASASSSASHGVLEASETLLALARRAAGEPLGASDQPLDTAGARGPAAPNA